MAEISNAAALKINFIICIIGNALGHPRIAAANRAKPVYIDNVNAHQSAHWADEPSKTATKRCGTSYPFLVPQKNGTGKSRAVNQTNLKNRGGAHQP